LKQKSDFLLSKWYLDCVAENGDTFIGYHATMKWKALSFHYSSFLTHTEDARTRTQTAFKKSSPPKVNDSVIEWVSEPLKIRGKWNSAGRAIQRQLIETEEGIVTWSCLMPRADAEISLGNSRYLPGTGYVEHLSLTLKPWLLPIHELRWGRFHSEHDTLIWIDWRGPNPQCLVFQNGILMNDCSINDMLITVNNGECTLLLEDRKILRDGPLVLTALSDTHGLEKVLPESMLQAHERKWRSKGLLSKNYSPAESGWVIHENVKL
jgi:hypothetical protein